MILIGSKFLEILSILVGYLLGAICSRRIFQSGEKLDTYGPLLQVRSQWWVFWRLGEQGLRPSAIVIVVEGGTSKAAGVVVVIDQATEVGGIHGGEEDFSAKAVPEEPRCLPEPLSEDAIGVEASEMAQYGNDVPEEGCLEEEHNEEVLVLNLLSVDEAEDGATCGREESLVRRVEKRPQEEIASPDGEKAKEVSRSLISSLWKGLNVLAEVMSSEADTRLASA